MRIELTDEMVEVFDKLIDKVIPERKAYVLRARLGMFGKIKTYKELGKELGVSGSRIQQYYNWSISKLRRVIFYNADLRKLFFIKKEV